MSNAREVFCVVFYDTRMLIDFARLHSHLFSLAITAIIDRGIFIRCGADAAAHIPQLLHARVHNNRNSATQTSEGEWLFKCEDVERGEHIHEL